jgi:hypothetical protein
MNPTCPDCNRGLHFLTFWEDELPLAQGLVEHPIEFE